MCFIGVVGFGDFLWRRGTKVVHDFAVFTSKFRLEKFLHFRIRFLFQNFRYGTQVVWRSITLYLMIVSCSALPLLGWEGGTEIALESPLEQCLINDWGVDTHTATYLMKKFQSLGCPAVDDFIARSKNINIDFAIPREVKPLPAEDAILCAPKQHLVIFENLYVRILWGSTLPNEREPLHIHQYKSLLVVLKPTIYEIEYLDGKVEIWNGEIGVYELPPGEHYTCTNIGNVADEMIRFEIKE